jgi:hypothetical protein
MTKVLIGILAVALASSAAWANLANGDFENCTLINQANWTAGTDQVGQWYGGPSMAIVGSVGSKYLANEVTGTATGFDHIQDSLQAMAIPAAGTYTLNASFQAGTDYNDQFFGFNVVLVQTGVAIPLTQTGYWPGVMSPPAGGKDILDIDPGNGTGADFDGNWHNLSDVLSADQLTFTISGADASTYQYLAVYAWSDRSSDAAHDQTSPANVDNVFTSAGAPVPEPMTMATVFMALGGLGAWVRRRMARPQG